MPGGGGANLLRVPVVTAVRPLLTGGLGVIQLLVLAASAPAQLVPSSSTTAVPAPATSEAPTTFVPPPGVAEGGPGDPGTSVDELEGEPPLDAGVGSPNVFVALSLAGGATALAIMGVQWVRTRPGP